MPILYSRMRQSGHSGKTQIGLKKSPIIDCLSDGCLCQPYSKTYVCIPHVCQGKCFMSPNVMVKRSYVLKYG